tara:strand:+ start:277 stop:447 length:171 start_codon:yes stop_codon:yes gene_type:complete
MKKGNAVATNHNTDKLLKELSAHRKKEGEVISSKVSIIADLVSKAHKREVKNNGLS